MSWFSKLKARVSISAGADVHAKALQPSTGQRRPRLEWTPTELSILSHAAKHSCLCYGVCDEYNASLQSVILGVDVDENQLLLDEFFPSPAMGLIDANLTLSLNTPTGALYLGITIVRRVAFAGGPALVAHITAKSTHQTVIQTATVAFAKDQAPAIELLLPMTPMMCGHVVELSPTGLSMYCAATRRPSLFTHSGECKITFSEHFRLKANVRIQHVAFSRKPFRHSLLRITFCSLPADQKEQLQAFLMEFKSAEEHCHRAA